MLNQLIEILANNSLQVADAPVFDLSSGKKSNLYIDCKKTTLTPRGLYLIKNVFFEKIAKLEIDGIGGLTLGADPIAIAVASISEERGHPIDAFVVRKEPKKHGSKRNIEGNLEKGGRVIIVDDVVTTGKSTVEAIQKAREDGLKVVKALVLVDRQEGGEENIRKENIDFEALITKKDLLDAYHKGRDMEGVLRRKSPLSNRAL